MNKSCVIGGVVSVAYVRAADRGFETHRAHNFLPLETERENEDGRAHSFLPLETERETQRWAGPAQREGCAPVYEMWRKGRLRRRIGTINIAPTWTTYWAIATRRSRARAGACLPGLWAGPGPVPASLDPVIESYVCPRHAMLPLDMNPSSLQEWPAFTADSRRAEHVLEVDDHQERAWTWSLTCVSGGQQELTAAWGRRLEGMNGKEKWLAKTKGRGNLFLNFIVISSNNGLTIYNYHAVISAIFCDE